MSTDANDTRPGFPPTREDQFWVGAMRQVVVDSMSGIHHAAMIVTLLSGIGLLGYLVWLLWLLTSERTAHSAIKSLCILLPAVLWLASVLFGTMALLIRRYRYFANSPDSSRLAFRRINRRKASYLNRALVCWTAGVLAVLLMVFVL